LPAGGSSGAPGGPRHVPLPIAVVLGLDELVGLQTARILARRGISVVGFATRPWEFGAKTRLVKRRIDVKSSADLVPALIEFGKTLDRRAILVPCTDELVLMVSRNRAGLDPYFVYSLPEPDVVEMLTDKEQFFRFALREKLPIPKTFLVTTPAEALEASASLRYPCILKPSLKSMEWWNMFHRKALILDDPAAFMAAYDEIRSAAGVLIAQEYIRGGEGELFSSNCYYDREGIPQVTFIARKIRQWPPLTGYTSLGEECRNDVVLAQSNLLFGKVRYHGLGYLEVKRDEVTGEHLIIEANIGRPTGRSSLAEGCGVELLQTMYADTFGLPLPPNRVQTYGGGKWIQFVNDARSAFFFWRRGELTVMEYLRSLRGIKVFAIESFSDPLPFVVDVYNKVRHGLGFPPRS
jgi:predicted ATP-grasp superfamily ATP-dependent carboligase